MAIADLIMPKMGESIMEATILKWHKRVGDHVKLDETVLDIATDKVDSEIPSPVAGIIAEILFPVNNVVPVGSVIAKIQTDVTVSVINHQEGGGNNDTVNTFASIPHTKVAAPIISETSLILPIESEPVIQHSTQNIQEPAFMELTNKSYEENTPFQPFNNAPKTGNNRFFSPLVLNIANSEGIALSELERIPGTGADGRVSKKDVLQYIADKRTGKVAAFVPNQPPPQVVYVTQPAVQEYHHQPIAESAPIQQFVQNKVADTPVYIAPQPAVEPVLQPIVEQSVQYQPIVEFPTEQSTFHEPVIYPQPKQENIIHESYVDQFSLAEIEAKPQPPVELLYQPIVETEHYVQPVVEPIYQQKIEQVQTVTQPIDELVAQPIFEAVHTPIVEPVQATTQSVVSVISETVIEPVQAFIQPVNTPIVEPVQAIVQPVVTPIPESGIEPVQPVVQTVAPPIVETISVTQPSTTVEINPAIEPIQLPKVVEELQSPSLVVPVEIPPIVVEKKIEEVITPVPQTEPRIPVPVAPELAQPKPIPVYMIPATAPTVPLVTLAEGGSGKYTTPDSAHPSGNVEIIEMDRMRKLISNHMVESKNTSAHVTSFTEADVTNMVLWRERVKVDFERREGTKLTFTPMFIDCIVKVLKRYPLLNSSVQGDKIIIKKDLNIGMATALPTGNLIVPVIKGADQLNIVGLSAAVNKLASSARANQLKPDDVTDGTFTFTNVGTFGTLMGTPIINQPQVAILAVGVIKKRPVVIESPNNDTIGIRHMMYLSLSYDHRIIDGSVGASFLSDVAKEMEAWDLNRTWYHYL